MSLRDVVGAVPYDFVYPSHSEGVRSKNDRVYAGSPVLLHSVLGVSGVSPEPMWGIPELEILSNSGRPTERSPL